MSNQGSNDRRPTKAERKEEARIERARIQRRLAARKRNRTIGIVLVVVAVAAAVGVGVAMGGSGSDLPSPKDVLAQADQAKGSAGCSDVKEIQPYNDVADPNDPSYADRAHIGGAGALATMPPLSSYPSVPPTSGPHNPVPLGGGVYASPPPIDQAIHSLEHAGAIVWYSPTAPQEVIDRITAFYERTDASVGATKVIVAPYDYPDQGDAGVLPDGAEMVLVAWHRMVTCDSPSLAVAYDFTSRFSNGPNGAGLAYEGEAPEPNVTI